MTKHKIRRIVKYAIFWHRARRLWLKCEVKRLRAFEYARLNEDLHYRPVRDEWIREAERLRRNRVRIEKIIALAGVTSDMVQDLKIDMVSQWTMHAKVLHQATQGRK